MRHLGHFGQINWGSERLLFAIYTKPATGNTYCAFKRLSVNMGKSHYRGIDWDITGRHKFAFGRVTAGLAGTHILKADYTKLDTKDDWPHNMNSFGVTDAVTDVRNVATQVPSYVTVDWQGRYDYSKNMSFRLGVKNLFNKQPPLPQSCVKCT